VVASIHGEAKNMKGHTQKRSGKATVGGTPELKKGAGKNRRYRCVVGNKEKECLSMVRFPHSKDFQITCAGLRKRKRKGTRW